MHAARRGDNRQTDEGALSLLAGRAIWRNVMGDVFREGVDHHQPTRTNWTIKGSSLEARVACGKPEEVVAFYFAP